MTKEIWVIMPVLAQPEMTKAAVQDVLAQSIPVKLLIVNQGVDDEMRAMLEQLAEEEWERVLVWSHQPSLPSLAATWNRALQFVWEAHPGNECALIVNNDVRLHRDTVRVLMLQLFNPDASEANLFVSAVGVKAEQFDPAGYAFAGIEENPSKGGPDFSCFLISKECHRTYPFDEGFTPAYCEDVDYHRRIMLAGDGARIFSVNLPFLHYACGTLLGVKDRRAIDKAIDAGSRAHYRRKWGGPVNQERYALPFDPESAQGDVTTPELQRAQAAQA